GAASGVLSRSRMVGSAFGVATMGALVTTIGRSKIDSSLPHLSAAARGTIASGLTSGGTAPGHHASPQVVAAVREAFVSALGIGLTVGAAAVFAGAIVAWALIQRTAARPELADAAPASAEPAPVETAA